MLIKDFAVADKYQVYTLFPSDFLHRLNQRPADRASSINKEKELVLFSSSTNYDDFTPILAFSRRGALVWKAILFLTARAPTDGTLLDRSATCLLRTYKAQMIKIRPVHITNWDAKRKSVTVQNLCVTEHLIKEKVKDKKQNSKREST